jgi:hypothetical protein
MAGGVVSHAGTALLRELADRSGLTQGAIRRGQPKPHPVGFWCRLCSWWIVEPTIMVGVLEASTVRAVVVAAGVAA